MSVSIKTHDRGRSHAVRSNDEDMTTIVMMTLPQSRSIAGEMDRTCGVDGGKERKGLSIEDD